MRLSAGRCFGGGGGQVGHACPSSMVLLQHPSRHYITQILSAQDGTINSTRAHTRTQAHTSSTPNLK